MTPKQTRRLFRKLRSAEQRFRNAIYEAQKEELIAIVKYADDSPLPLLSDAWERIIRTTEKNLASAFREECSL